MTTESHLASKTSAFELGYRWLPKVGSPLPVRIILPCKVPFASISPLYDNSVLYVKSSPKTEYAEMVVIVFSVEAGAKPIVSFFANTTLPEFASITHKDTIPFFRLESFSNSLYDRAIFCERLCANAVLDTIKNAKNKVLRIFILKRFGLKNVKNNHISE